MFILIQYWKRELAMFKNQISAFWDFDRGPPSKDIVVEHGLSYKFINKNIAIKCSIVVELEAV